MRFVRKPSASRRMSSGRCSRRQSRLCCHRAGIKPSLHSSSNKTPWQGEQRPCKSRGDVKSRMTLAEIGLDQSATSAQAPTLAELACDHPLALLPAPARLIDPGAARGDQGKEREAQLTAQERLTKREEALLPELRRRVVTELPGLLELKSLDIVETSNLGTPDRPILRKGLRARSASRRPRSRRTGRRARGRLSCRSRRPATPDRFMPSPRPRSTVSPESSTSWSRMPTPCGVWGNRGAFSPAS